VERGELLSNNEARLRTIFDTVFVVLDSVEIYEAQRQGVPISHYAPRSSAGKECGKIAKIISINAEQKPYLDK